MRIRLWSVALAGLCASGCASREAESASPSDASGEAEVSIPGCNAEAHGNRTVAREPSDAEILDESATRDHARPRRLTIANSAGESGSPGSPPGMNRAGRELLYRLAEAFKRAVARDDLETAVRIWTSVAERLPRRPVRRGARE
ncbi:MAG: hypothetical protein HYV09_26830 [Deltaproteobacteria bacterium]|nr:hypothetical protein [Deltaproteobacteria bacterium]